MRKRTAVSLTVGTMVLFVALGVAGNAITSTDTPSTNDPVRTVESVAPAGTEVTYTTTVIDGDTKVEKRTVTQDTVTREIVEAY